MASIADASTQSRNLGATASSNFIGAGQTNLRTWGRYRPSAIEFPDQIWDLQASKGDPRPAFPLPEGWRLMMPGKASASGCFGQFFFGPNHFAKQQLALQVDTPSAKRFRNVFGYVSFIKPEEFEGSITPLCAQVVIKRPFNYGTLSWGKAFIPRTAG